MIQDDRNQHSGKYYKRSKSVHVDFFSRKLFTVNCHLPKYKNIANKKTKYYDSIAY